MEQNAGSKSAAKRFAWILGVILIAAIEGGGLYVFRLQQLERANS